MKAFFFAAALTIALFGIDDSASACPRCRLGYRVYGPAPVVAPYYAAYPPAVCAPLPVPTPAPIVYGYIPQPAPPVYGLAYPHPRRAHFYAPYGFGY